jgi:uncharacterized protein (TIGR00730 family)
MKRICVYCGSSSGTRSSYAKAARSLAAELVKRDLELVYGGAEKGLMGIIANAVLENGGTVHGVIPELLCGREVSHPNLTDLHVVASMHERKALMEELSDGFIALPGGYGTLEEIIEIVTWRQLAIHNKPCGLLNVDGFFDPLTRYLDLADREGFLRSHNRKILLSETSASSLLDKFELHH